jgi:hypothetical protein
VVAEAALSLVVAVVEAGCELVRGFLLLLVQLTQLQLVLVEGVVLLLTHQEPMEQIQFFQPSHQMAVVVVGQTLLTAVPERQTVAAQGAARVVRALHKVPAP